MLGSKIWDGKLGLGWNDNLCIACIERRLKRKLSLRLHDFISFPFVKAFQPWPRCWTAMGSAKRRGASRRTNSQEVRRRVAHVGFGEAVVFILIVALMVVLALRAGT